MQATKQPQNGGWRAQGERLTGKEGGPSPNEALSYMAERVRRTARRKGQSEQPSLARQSALHQSNRQLMSARTTDAERAPHWQGGEPNETLRYTGTVETYRCRS